jgi:hypothetical protein
MIGLSPLSQMLRKLQLTDVFMSTQIKQSALRGRFDARNMSTEIPVLTTAHRQRSLAKAVHNVILLS